MAKQIDNSLQVFSRRVSPVPIIILASAALICLFAGVAMALAISNFALIAVIALSLVFLAAFIYLHFVQFNRLSAEADGRRVDWQTAHPDIQRQSLNIEVFELSKILEVETDQMSDLQSAYIVAEDLALRQIQQEENVPLMRHVSLCKAPFDAVLVSGETIICVEASFLVAPDIRQEKIDAMIRKVEVVKAAFDATNVSSSLRLMVVLVTQLTPEDDEHLRSVINKQRIENSPVDVEFRFLDFEALQRIYITN